jgi:uncharacterized peroxidase-related enzyme
MSRISIPSREDAPAESVPLLDAVSAQLGVVPNMFRAISLSPAALEGYLSLNGALGKTLDIKTRERIALTVAEATECDYCLSAHSYLGANVAKLDEPEMAANRNGRSNDVRADAAVIFARKVVQVRGKVADADLAAVKMAGYSDAQIIEIVVTVALNLLTNLINNVVDTEIDFPVVRRLAA